MVLSKINESETVMTGANNPSVEAAPEDQEVFSLERFPKEFEKGLLDSIDRRFALIWLTCFVVHFATVFYFSKHPPAGEVTQDQILNIQRQFASLVLSKGEVTLEEKSVVGTAEAVAAKEEKPEKAAAAEGEGGMKGGGGRGEGEGGGTGTGTGVGVGSGVGAGVGGGRRTMDMIAQEVSSKGVLAVLTGSGEAAGGEGAEDILGGGGASGENLDELLGNVSGLKTSGRRGGVGGFGEGTGGGGGGIGVRGGRATGGGGIDALVSELGTARSTRIARKGGLVVQKVTPIAEEGAKVAVGGRDPDAVSAVVNSHNDAIEYCYQRELKRTPDLRGEISVRFTIDTEGKVISAQIVSSSLNNPEVERCVLSRVRRWDDFGPAKVEATFRQVYTFGY